MTYNGRCVIKPNQTNQIFTASGGSTYNSMFSDPFFSPIEMPFNGKEQMFKP